MANGNGGALEASALLDSIAEDATWTAGEDDALIAAVEVWGGSWAAFARALPGRTAEACRLRYETLQRRSPVTPAPPASAPSSSENQDSRDALSALAALAALATPDEARAAAYAQPQARAAAAEEDVEDMPSSEEERTAKEEWPAADGSSVSSDLGTAVVSSQGEEHEAVGGGNASLAAGSVHARSEEEGNEEPVAKAARLDASP